MTPIKECLINKSTKHNPIWLMRQAGRYLPEFREIRKKNPNFIELCLNETLSEVITLQPVERFDFDAAIIFSDILMIPFGLGQKVDFKKNFGPQLGEIKIDEKLKLNDDSFSKKLKPIYKLLRNLKSSPKLDNKDLIGFVGAPWTLLVYMINKISPKNGLSKNFFKDEALIKNILNILDRFIKLHVKNQVESGATIIQIFDSWAGLINRDFEKFLYEPTISLVEYTKNLGASVICFPRNIKNYKIYCDKIKPDAINIDYNVNIENILNDLTIPIQGGMNPEILLTDKETLKKETKRYLDIFKDHPYIFNLGHGILPNTDPSMVDYLVKMVKDY
tara:strand:- start:3395 stop:4393 length:999 start_codon:yes stop_codon:yes gene_type:complete